MLLLTKSIDVYMYGVGLVAILAVGLCVFYTFKKLQQAVQQAEDKQTKKFV